MGFLHNPRVNTINKHLHSSAKCHPSLGAGIVVAGGAGIWQLGNSVEIIPVNTITSAFDIHWITFEAVSANETYELVLYTGDVGSEVEIGRVRAFASALLNLPIQMPIQPPNARISAKLASASGGDSATISIQYHTY